MPTPAPTAQAAIRPRILNTEEAAQYIGRSINFVRRTLRYECAVVQHGYRGPLGFYETDLDRWIARHTHEPVE